MRRSLVCLALGLVLAVSACHKKKKGASDADEPPAHEVKENVTVEVDDSGFHPKTIWAKQGQPITITFKRTEENTCATAVLIPDEDVRKELPLGQPVKVVLLPGRKGTLHFACPQNTLGGDIIVQ